MYTCVYIYIYIHYNIYIIHAKARTFDGNEPWHSKAGWEDSASRYIIIMIIITIINMYIYIYIHIYIYIYTHVFHNTTFKTPHPYQLQLLRVHRLLCSNPTS